MPLAVVQHEVVDRADLLALAIEGLLAPYILINSGDGEVSLTELDERAVAFAVHGVVPFRAVRPVAACRSCVAVRGRRTRRLCSGESQVPCRLLAGDRSRRRRCNTACIEWQPDICRGGTVWMTSSKHRCR